jgi:hypothetical protein
MSLAAREFAGYHLLRRLGGGGMGEVYLARTRDGREVALKLIHVHDDDDSRDIVAAERLGAQLQKQFGTVDPHVPAVHTVGEAEGYFFIEMEYVDGHDLAELIPGRVAPERAASIAADVAAFLERAHGFSAEVGGREFRALVHADLKPKNIRINSRNEVKVLDFGISKGLSLTGRLTTAAFGSRSYMSPEWLETGRLDHHVDLWALGVVLYEMIAGHPPYKTENARQLELAVRSGTPPLPLPDTCPTALARIVLKALAPRLPARYSTAQVFKSDLDAWLAGRPTQADAEWAEALTAEMTRRTDRAPATTDDANASAGGAEATRRTGRPLATGDPAEATRRTDRADSSSEATTRTMTPGEPAVPAEARAADVHSVPDGPSRWRLVRRWGGLVVLGLLLLAVSSEYSACRSATQLRAELPTRQEADLDAAWNRYQQIEGQSSFGIARRQVSGAMSDALVTHADRVIADFRHDRPTVRERQWQQARTWLGNALRIDPRNRVLLSRLRYCEGQLSRIDGEARARDGQRQEADRLLHDAVARFEESANLDRAWPDPWLGLLRTYVVGIEDLGKAVGALNEAERRGYRGGRREFAQLGDAHAARAAREARECDRLPAESACACLQRSGELFRQAVSWYQRVEGSPDTSRAIVKAHSGLAAVTERLGLLACE